MNKMLLTCICICTLCAFDACKKDNTTPNYNMAANAYVNFIYSIDTLPFTASSATNVYAVDSAGMCIITGVESINYIYGSYQHAELEFVVKNYKGPGTYVINDSDVFASYGYSAPDTTVGWAPMASGQLVINVSGETVSGTFNCTGFEAVITGGSYTASGRGF